MQPLLAAPIKIQGIRALRDNYIWLLTEPQTAHTLIVDPGAAIPVIAALEDQALTPVGILITHHHWDHTAGVNDLLSQYDIPVWALTPQYQKAVNVPPVATLCMLHPSFPAFNILAIPGHTLDHIAYHVGDALFCGDTLFTAGCGRLFEGSAIQLYQSLQTLAQLPEDTLIYCGHEYTESNLCFASMLEPDNHLIRTRLNEVKALRKAGKPTVPSTLATEKSTNPFLRCHLPQIRQVVEAHSQVKLTHTVTVFEALRAWKDTY